VVPYARNARTHSDEQIAQIAGSIREFGFTNPVLLDGDSGILAGHGRVLAARKLGMTEAPCLADNKLALNAGWDPELLKGYTPGAARRSGAAA
jgi:ParB-like chromosome segregation protein Spo0J